ncbi:hypothetical protein FY133_24610 (plasmid) [Agrobacterium tumefaciens]|uniref:Pirin family protein n=2 Tax=Agrobacterium tumefaciens TaxID=358 RepID=A0AAP9J935_AGRTU|nr:pirin family protein [Agrobacterium tumefaciens]NSZ60016.1 hypothetical protein [Agrobacterium tumefaciens]QDY97619.1 hypothetical protein CG010_026015 [Agrobacterium tumefaciens]UXS12744.1 hypothetical protein FY155_24160 [Agrobacterium tumefaciens]UXS20106.1 hypothetical protein FY154_24155 [Agrobacterium tumefaciens]UXS27753.1 hypothetical protein FY153_24995 [Agrobacterium tumefaciens]
MLQILRSSESSSFAQGPFKIRRIRPGAILGQNAGPAFGPFSVMDHANLDVGTVVSMHEHKNDEILSYMWRGSMVHEDSAGHRIAISPTKLMMMNAGRSFWHEESTPDVPVEMLQIFIRPAQADLDGTVNFFDRPNDFLNGDWNLIAAPEEGTAPLRIRQAVTFYDAHLLSGDEIVAPSAPSLTPWLYVMDGVVSLGDEFLGKGDAVTDLESALPAIKAEAPSTLVLFLVNRQATGSMAGTISGR